MNTWSQEKYKTAWNFATHYHQGQTFKGPAEGEQVDYLNHIGSVAMEVIWALGATPDLDGDLAVQCALLHDVIEDTHATLELVLEKFGERVAAGVLALTKDKNLPGKPAQMADSLARIRQQPREVWLVKLADRITNLYPPPFDWDNAKILAYEQEARQIYDALHTANTALAQRLLEKIEQYPRYIRQAGGTPE